MMIPEVAALADNVEHFIGQVDGGRRPHDNDALLCWGRLLRETAAHGSRGSGAGLPPLVAGP